MRALFAVALACLDAVLLGVTPNDAVLPVLVIMAAVAVVSLACMGLTRRPGSWAREDRRRFAALGGKRPR